MSLDIVTFLSEDEEAHIVRELRTDILAIETSATIVSVIARDQSKDRLAEAKNLFRLATHLKDLKLRMERALDRLLENQNQQTEMEFN